jgi:hypothetical protein
MTAWSEIVNSNGSDEWLELCNAALAEVKSVQSSRLRGGLESRIYEALVTFQATAQWSTLQHAQMRQHLAEHLAQALTNDTQES